MLTFFSFIAVLVGSFNWFFIASFQYDFIAGFFGTQSSLFSRFIYFIIGMAGFVLLVMAFKNKGKLKITENSFKKQQKPVEVEKQEPEKEDYSSLISPETPKQVYMPIEKTTDNEGYKDFDASKYD